MAVYHVLNPNILIALPRKEDRPLAATKIVRTYRTYFTLESIALPIVN